MGKIEVLVLSTAVEALPAGPGTLSPSKQTGDFLGALAHLCSHYTLLLQLWEQPLCTVTYLKSNSYFLNVPRAMGTTYNNQ